MKLRIRLRNETRTVSILKDPNEATVEELKSLILKEYLLESLVFDLSLNGREKLTQDQSATLQDLGLVSGDLLVLLTEEDVNVPKERPQLLDKLTSSVVYDLGSNGPASSSSENGRFHTLGNGTEHANVNKEDNLVCDSTAIHYNMDDDDCIEMTEHESDPLVNRYLNEPMLCRDCVEGIVPHILEQLYTLSDVNTMTDALVIVLHVLMMEAGFMLKDDTKSDACSVTSTSMPVNWREKNGYIYKLQYQHPQCGDMVCQIVCVPLGSTVMTVNGFVLEHENMENVCMYKIHLLDYVRQTDNACCNVYKNLSKLSRTFKDAIAYLLIGHIKQKMGLQNLHGLMNLIFEEKMLVCSHLDATSLLRLSEVCKELSTVAKDKWLWRRLFLKDFRGRINNDLNQNWLQLYKEAYLHRKEVRGRFRNIPPLGPPFFGIPGPSLPPFGPVYPPGVIGGDYDLNPNFQGLLPGHTGNPLLLSRPRYDPFNPLPDNNLFRPGRGRGLQDLGGRYSNRSSFMRFF